MKWVAAKSRLLLFSERQSWVVNFIEERCLWDFCTLFGSVGVIQEPVIPITTWEDADSHVVIPITTPFGNPPQSANAAVPPRSSVPWRSHSMLPVAKAATCMKIWWSTELHFDVQKRSVSQAYPLPQKKLPKSRFKLTMIYIQSNLCSQNLDEFWSNFNYIPIAFDLDLFYPPKKPQRNTM